MMLCGRERRQEVQKLIEQDVWLVSFKHPSYREEREWRLIQFGRQFRGDPSHENVIWSWRAKVRPRGGAAVPCADLNLTPEQTAQHKGPLIRRIVFGPRVDAPRGETAVRL